MNGGINRTPCVIMRGGTSRGPYFKASDLPADVAARDRVLLAVMGSPHPMQLDGIGGSYTVTSKVAIVSPSACRARRRRRRGLPVQDGWGHGSRRIHGPWNGALHPGQKDRGHHR